MSDFEFDSCDGDEDEYFIIGDESSINSNTGYGDYITNDRNYREEHCHYKNAHRFTDESEADDALSEAEAKNGKSYSVIRLSH